MKFFILYNTLTILLTFDYTFCSGGADIFCTQEVDLVSVTQDEVLQSDISVSEEDNVDQETDETDLSKKLGSEDLDNGHFKKKKDKLTRLQSQKLRDLFDGCDKEMSQILKFSECFDVLTWVDMSILLIYDITNALSNNQDKYEFGIYEDVYKVNLEFKNFHKLILDVENLLIRYKTRLSSSRKIFSNRRLSQEKFEYIKNGVITSKNRMLALKEKFYRYKLFPIKDYHYATFIKIEKLNSLHNHLNRVRNEISLLDEDEILLHHSILKNKILKPISDIYEKLIEFRDRECGALPLFFVHDGLNEILNDIKKSLNVLQSLKEDLKYAIR